MKDQDFNQLKQITDQVQQLQSTIHRMRIILILTFLAISLITVTGFVKIDNQYIKVRGVTIVDAKGKPRILLGAPPATEGRIRKDAQVPSLVVLDSSGHDRLILGEEPDPIIGNKTYHRVAVGYGLIIHDKNGLERGGIGFLDNGRGVISLDRPNQDAVEMVVNDKSGFAGLTVNYGSTIGSYHEGVRIGTKGNEAWWTLSDSTETERAGIHVKNSETPQLILNKGKK